MEIIRSFLFGSLMVLMFACGGETCQERMAVNCIITFRKASSEQVHTFEKDTLTVFGLNEYNQVMDSALYRRVVGLKYIELPLRTGKEQEMSRFLIQYNLAGLVDEKNVFIDTLTVIHTNVPNFVSISCGCNVLSNVTEMRITTEMNSSVRITDAQTSTQNKENGSIYF